MVIIPGARKHCAVYGGIEDRIMIGVNFIASDLAAILSGLKPYGQLIPKVGTILLTITAVTIFSLLYLILSQQVHPHI